ncbi:MAG: hypothetical protein WCO78_00295 [Candidatus Roizmanbacteria bacterium]
MSDTLQNNSSSQDPYAVPIDRVALHIPDPWSIELLIKKAFLRTKSRMLTYLLLQLISSMVSSAVLTVTLGISVAIVAVLIIAGQQMVALVVGLLLFLVIVIIAVYVSSLFQIASVRSIITEDPILDTIKMSRQLLNPYLTLTLWQGLFMLGLLPIGLVTSFIVPVVWSLLFSFANFILITSTTKGASILWASKDMILSKFWGIVGRYILLTILISTLTSAGIALIGFVLSLFGVGLVSLIGRGNPEAAQSSLSTLQTIVSLFVNSLGYIVPLIIAPMYTAYLFEMYLLIPVPDIPKKPKIWIGLSAISVITMFALFFYGYFAFVLPEIMTISQKTTNKSIGLFQQQVQTYIQDAVEKAQTMSQ